MPMSVRFEDVEYMVHNEYDLYGSNINGDIVHIFKGTKQNGYKSPNGEYRIMVRKYGLPSYKNIEIGRFVWECYNGSTPDGYIILHINGNNADNRLVNLKCVSIQDVNNSTKNKENENGKRDYSFAKYNHANRKYIKATNQDDGSVSYYHSLYAVNKHLHINPGVVKLICEGRQVSATSTLNNCFTFQYINRDDMPSDSIKSRDIRPNRIPEEIKKARQRETSKLWRELSWVCPNCGQTYKNGIKYYHRQKCNFDRQK